MSKTAFDLTGKTALVVGGNGFLGCRLCNELIQHGATVYAADLRESSLAASRDDSLVLEKKVLQRTVDVADSTSVVNLVDGIIEEAKKIDILVYSVTAKPHDFYKPFTECSLEGWQSLMRIELDGLFLISKHVGKYMEAAGEGSMVFLSSIYGIVGNDQRIYEEANLSTLYAGIDKDEAKKIYSHAGYAVAKGGVIALTRFLAAYWGKAGIRVNCVSPGGISHPGEDDGFVQRYSFRVPMGRKGLPSEVGGAVVYLSSNAASYVTGHNLVVDGGWTSW